MAKILRSLPFALAPVTALVTGAALSMVAACSAEVTSPQPQRVPPPAPAPAAAPEPAAAAQAAEPAPPPSGVEPAPPLTEEELALIAADPKDLTPEMRRQRAYARRKQIMQDPDSPTARALNDLVEAHQAGEIDANGGKGTWLHARGTKPTEGRPPAGWRPSDGTKPAPAPSETADQP